LPEEAQLMSPYYLICPTASTCYTHDLQPFQRLADAALTASEPLRPLMLKGIGFLLNIAGKTRRVDLCRRFISAPAGFDPLRPSLYTRFFI
jgi:hypothetical protein